jgi:hypothetical protein
LPVIHIFRDTFKKFCLSFAVYFHLQTFLIVRILKATISIELGSFFNTRKYYNHSTASTAQRLSLELRSCFLLFGSRGNHVDLIRA